MKDSMKWKTKDFQFKDGRSDRVGTVVCESFKVARDSVIKDFGFIRPSLVKISLHRFRR